MASRPFCDCVGKHSASHSKAPEDQRPLMFGHGSACLSHLLRTSRFQWLGISSVLVVGCTDGHPERAICSSVFGTENVCLTGTGPVSIPVLGTEAVVRYGHLTDALMFCFPHTLQPGGYDSCLDAFEGDVVVFVGETDPDGHHNPDGLLESISRNFYEMDRVDILKVPQRACSDCVSSLVLYARKTL
ncbi:hypothetical protein SERV_ORF69 [short-finned eel virus]|uniref:Uncharacterized protein n=1 Tax=short-finned eel virus TaxID=2848076 RepID=A0A192GR51_FRG3V|nr:hypothetical protein SERV_ORF69 [Short-finned eel ranavirus]ANK58079.1 hypothetical protein SERV_ORF69 [Short-finned eel ranavirus]